jgi:hypothetical protein
MHGRWRRGATAGAALLGLGLSGCAQFWDDITSRDRPFSQRWKEIWHKPDPLVVLRDSQDGDRRAAAMRRLEEPKQHKGTDQEQDLIFEILSKAAVADPQPLCRLVAIDKLGHFKDPRAPKTLEAAFYGVDTIPGQFANMTTRIQCAALNAMGNTGNTEVVPLLAQVLREPPADRSDEAQHRNDRCAAAARALAHFNDAQATDALLRMMQNKKEDLALRDVAYLSLRDSTGKVLPNDPQKWDEFLHPRDGTALAKEDGTLIHLASWFKKDTDLRPPEELPPNLKDKKDKKDKEDKKGSSSDGAKPTTPEGDGVPKTDSAITPASATGPGAGGVAPTPGPGAAPRTSNSRVAPSGAAMPQGTPPSPTPPPGSAPAPASSMGAGANPPSPVPSSP